MRQIATLTLIALLTTTTAQANPPRSTGPTPVEYARSNCQRLLNEVTRELDFYKFINCDNIDCSARDQLLLLQRNYEQCIEDPEHYRRYLR